MPLKVCAILGIEDGIWALEGPGGGIDNNVVNDGGISFAIDSEETERILAKVQRETFVEVRGFLDSTEIISHGFPDIIIGLGLDVKRETEGITPINWGGGKGRIQFELVGGSWEIRKEDNMPLAVLFLWS